MDSAPALDTKEAVRAAARELGLTASDVGVEGKASRTRLMLGRMRYFQRAHSLR
jgi:hypothetical protein